MHICIYVIYICKHHESCIYVDIQRAKNNVIAENALLEGAVAVAAGEADGSKGLKETWAPPQGFEKLQNRRMLEPLTLKSTGYVTLASAPSYLELTCNLLVAPSRLLWCLGYNRSDMQERGLGVRLTPAVVPWLFCLDDKRPVH